jgi:cytochrome bd-type quinol oxidase subunit 1
VVSGVVMAFQFGTNWSVLSNMSGPIQGPLLSYETFTAFALEAGFFGILILGRQRVAPWFYFFSTAMVALGTTLSAFWIMVNNSWMQVPVGYVVQNGQYVPDDWTKILFNSVVWSRFPHMLLASYLTGAFSQPPPSAKPLIAAITGLPRFSTRSSTSCPELLDRSASIALACASSLMSAPATNALSPAPVRMTPRTASSSRACSKAVRRSFHVGVFRALSTLGRLTVTEAIAPRFSYRTFASVRTDADESAGS